MPEGNMKCKTKTGDCPITAMWGADLCIVHIEEACPDYATPLSYADYMPDLVDH